MLKSFFTTILIGFITMVTAQKTIGNLVSADPAFFDLVDKNAAIELLADGFSWSEGPVWVKDGGYLLFSDVKKNTIFKWKKDEGVTPFLKPSGYTGTGNYSDEPGSNGLILNLQGQLVACEHGDRRVSVMPLSNGGKVTLTDNYNGTRYNSPNDIVQKSNGDYYFTDPAYGLPIRNTTNKMGVYRLSAKGKVTMLVESLTPNGLAFSPDENYLYVNQSLSDKAYIMRYSVKKDGTLADEKLFFDATYLVKEGLPGLPDGLKLDVKGNLFSTGPGGVLVISNAGKLLGRIDTGDNTANCNWGDDGSVLYMTVNNKLCRIQTKTKGARF